MTSPPVGVDEIQKFHHGTFDAECGNFAAATGRGSPFHSLGIQMSFDPWKKLYLIVSTIVGGFSAFGVVFSFAFAHGSPTVGMIVFGLIMPAASIGKLIGIDDTVNLSSTAFVGALNFVVAYLACLAIGFIRFAISRERK